MGQAAQHLPALFGQLGQSCKLGFYLLCHSVEGVCHNAHFVAGMDVYPFMQLPLAYMFGRLTQTLKGRQDFPGQYKE